MSKEISNTVVSNCIKDKKTKIKIFGKKKKSEESAPLNTQVWYKAFFKMDLSAKPLPRYSQHTSKSFGPHQHSPESALQGLGDKPSPSAEG